MDALRFGFGREYILGRPGTDPKRWLDEGFAPIHDVEISALAMEATWHVEENLLRRFVSDALVRSEFLHTSWERFDLRLADALWFMRPPMLSRVFPAQKTVFQIPDDFFPKPPERTKTAHYVVLETVDEDGKPVSDVRFELVFADGDSRRASTDSDGIARIDGIHASRVVIRLLGMDGGMWKPDSGALAELSSQDAPRWHVVKRGENLSRIAKQYGLKSWKQIWDNPKNEPLRKKRKNPNVIHPGDEVSVPGPRVLELHREVDATHRIVVQEALFELKVKLGDHHGRPYRQRPYELRYTGAIDEVPMTGTTGSAGEVRHFVRASAERLFVSLPDLDLTWPLMLAPVPPLPDEVDAQAVPDEVAVRAVQTRLNALGIASGEVNGVWNTQTRLALQQLRRGHGITSDALLCSEDLDALRRYGV